jgi:hypothetical protein
MPYISTKTSVPVSDEKREAIKKSFGKAIEIFPGKSERWLMLSFEDNAKMYFAGSDSGAAFVEVKLLGRASGAAFDKMTAEICNILSKELSVPQDRIYVKYEECEHWGWNGGNF